MRARPAVARAVGVVVVLAATTVTGPAQASSSPDPHDEAVAEVADELAAERAELEAVEISSEMAADATSALDDADATFALDPADATSTHERTVEEADDTVVTLTSDLLFDFGSAELTDRAAEAVADLAEQVPQDAFVQVDGHTDAVGSDADNQALSEERAQAVADVLVAARGDLDLQVVGHGETRPVADNTVGGEDNPAGRALNRRVEVTYPTP